MIYSCGCINDLDHEWGVVKCLRKCDHHRDYLVIEKELGHEYYQRLGTVDSVAGPKTGQHVKELVDATDVLNWNRKGPTRPSTMLEIGCGCSPYVEFFTSLGYDYSGLDTREWAVEWMAHAYPFAASGMWHLSWEAFPEGTVLFDVIFAAHSLEHMENAPAALSKMYRMLKPGGRVCILVPDDQDPTNPDHLWFFTETTLRALMAKVGFTDLQTTVKRVVPQELFIYATGVK